MREHAIDNEMLLGEVCKLLDEGKQVKLRAKGNSMRPFIHNGDTIVMAPRAEYRKGEVVLAYVEGCRYVVHRIIGTIDTGFILMGDGNLYGKECCGRKEVAGRVGLVIHNGKKRNLLTKGASFKASCWRFLLPLRRVRYKIRKRIFDT